MGQESDQPEQVGVLVHLFCHKLGFGQDVRDRLAGLDRPACQASYLVVGQEPEKLAVDLAIDQERGAKIAHGSEM